MGNGGLSLRRNAACVCLLNEFPQATQMFVQTGSANIFFAIMVAVNDFLVPNGRVASHFALELRPDYYAVNDNLAPWAGMPGGYSQAF